MTTLTVEIEGQVLELSEWAVARSGYFRNVVRTFLESASPEERSAGPRTKLFRDLSTFRRIRKYLEGYHLVLSDLSSQELSDLQLDADYFAIEDLITEVHQFRQGSTQTPTIPRRWATLMFHLRGPTPYQTRYAYLLDTESFHPERFRDLEGEVASSTNETPTPMVLVLLARNISVVRLSDKGFKFHWPIHWNFDANEIRMHEGYYSYAIEKDEHLTWDENHDRRPFEDEFIATKVFIQVTRPFLTQDLSYEVALFTLVSIPSLLGAL